MFFAILSVFESLRHKLFLFFLFKFFLNPVVAFFFQFKRKLFAS